MKFSILVCSLAAVAHAFAPQETRSLRTHRPTSTTQLDMNKGGWWGSAAAALAGWTLATQLAGASLLPMTRTEQVMTRQPTTLVAAFGEGIDTMDFSLPSYSEATKGTIKKLAGPPSFNPFGDFTPEKVDSGAKFEKAAAEKAAAEAKKAEEKEAKKAAAEAKKADKEARRKAESAKQKAATERILEEVAPAPAPVVEEEEEQFSFPQISDFKAPDLNVEMPKIDIPAMPKLDMPKLDMPKLDMPKFDMPKFEMPKMDMPKLDMPKLDMPDMPKLDMPDMPKMDMPKFEMPAIKAPDLGDGYNLDLPPAPKMPAMPKIDLPKVELPKFSMPSMPTLPKTGDYDFDIPAPPKIDIPQVNLPKVSLPSIPNPFGGGASSGSVEEEELEPQEVRDERAREARQVFLSFDDDAKQVEARAREARNLANEKKKLANEAKDEACKTRPGGKWICLRNPFTAGF